MAEFALLTQARALDATGQTETALALCQAFLELEPDHQDAVHLAAVLACRSGRLEDGIALTVRALTLAPQHPDLWQLMGDAQQLTGQAAAAALSFRQALTHGQMRMPAAWIAVLWSKLGIALANTGEWDAALAAHDAAIHHAPHEAQAYFNRALAKDELGRSADAAADYAAAIGLDPGQAGFFLNYANVLLDLDRLDDAEQASAQAMALTPENPLAHMAHGLVMERLNRLEEARADHAYAISLDPGNADAWLNLGNVHYARGDFDKALAVFDHTVTLVPDRASAHSNRAMALLALRQPDQALAAHEQAVAAAPQDPTANFGLALCRLTLGQWREGWRGYEWRHAVPALRLPPLPDGLPRWNGGACDGRHLVVHLEQGFGDALQFVRFVPVLADRGATVTVMSPPALLRLLRQCLPPSIHILPTGAPLPAADDQVAAMSLPWLLDIPDPAHMPQPPYVTADPALTAGWHDRLGPDGHRLRVGLVWSGNPKHRRDASRSIDPAPLFQALSRPQFQLFSLQKAIRPDHAPILASCCDQVTDLAPLLDDFADTAAVLANLDVLVSVDTATLHLAGAMGLPALGLIAHDNDWRWMLDRGDSPWYPSLTLIRQPGFRRWDMVAVMDHLLSMAERKNGCPN